MGSAGENSGSAEALAQGGDPRIAANSSSASPGREALRDRAQAADLASLAARPASEPIMSTLRGADKAEATWLPRLKLFSDMPDRGLFAICVVIGFVIIVGVKTYIWEKQLTDHFTLEITVFTAILMIAYGVLAYRLPDVRLRPDRLGDNFYYMGFIFTLASMSAALVQLQRGDDVGALISSFGIALASTILGIAGRVFFVQMRTEVEDIEERVRQDLLAAAGELKGQLGAATRDLDSFRTGVQQAIHERFEETSKAFSEVLASQTSRTHDATERTILAVQTSFREHEESAARLIAVGTSVTDASNRLASRLDAVSVPSDALERQLSVVSQRLDGLAAGFERAAEAERARYAELGESAAQLRKVTTQIATQIAKIQELSLTFGATVEPTTQLSRSVEATRTSIDTAKASIAELGKAIEQAQTAVVSMTNAAKAHGLELQRLQGEVATATSQDAATARAALQRDLEASRAAVIEVQKALAEMVRAITAGLGPANP